MIPQVSFVYLHFEIFAVVTYMCQNDNLYILFCNNYQMLVSLSSGPLDSLFGGCNLPAFALGGIAAAVGAIVVFKLPLP